MVEEGGEKWNVVIRMLSLFLILPKFIRCEMSVLGQNFVEL